MDQEQTSAVPTQAKTYKMPEALRIALLQYLMARPYAEVADGVAALQNLEVIP